MSPESGPPIYLDNNATTPLDPRVLAVMQRFLQAEFGNAASPHHRLGTRAAEAVEVARGQVAAVLGADPREVCFTSGATESNNLALLGLAGSSAYEGRRHLVTVRTEHPSVLDPCRHLESRGFAVTFLPVDGRGELDLDRLAAAIRADTLVVSVMHGNNETGVLHPIAAIGALCRERGTLFHTDAVQTFGKEPIDVGAASIDLLSLSAHKIHGPKGVGALFVRRKGPRVRCAPILHGGGHERGLRPGTANVPGIVGLGVAASLGGDPVEQARLRGLRDRLEAELLGGVPGAKVHGAGAPRLAGTLNISFPTAAETIIERTPGLALSTASACTSASRQPSYVLGAMGAGEAEVRGSLRISLGRFTTEGDIEAAVQQLIAANRHSDRPDYNFDSDTKL